MYKQENIKPYDAAEEKGTQVARMFDNIAGRYDTFNHAMSFSIDWGWRKKAIKQLAPYKPQRILDIATGTGDLAILEANMLHPAEILGVDISEGMMQVGRDKVEKAGLQQVISFRMEDCLSLSIDSNSYDAVTAAFGIRNFADLDKGLSEMHRVLKPGGHLSIVEMCAPQRFPMKQLFKIYSHTIMPIAGRLMSHDKNAYTYLTSSIEAFPQGEQMVEILKKTGFSEAEFKRLTCGICTMYLATK